MPQERAEESLLRLGTSLCGYTSTLLELDGSRPKKVGCRLEGKRRRQHAALLHPRRLFRSLRRGRISMEKTPRYTLARVGDRRRGGLLGRVKLIQQKQEHTSNHTPRMKLCRLQWRALHEGRGRGCVRAPRRTARSRRRESSRSNRLGPRAEGARMSSCLPRKQAKGGVRRDNQRDAPQFSRLFQKN